MRIPFLTYCPLVAPRYFPYVSVRSAGPGSPHTSGVRLAPHGSFATEPCRPTACTGITAEPAPNVHYSLFIVQCWFYTFSAKEKDSETGLSYFGSRYYSSDLSIWLSVDPQAAKYASLSPYNYCANNPVKLVDPNGEKVWIGGEDWEVAFASLQQGTNLLLSIQNGNVTIIGGEVLNDNDNQLFEAINNNNVIALIIASKHMPDSDGDGHKETSDGHCFGATYSEQLGKSVATNYVNVQGLSKMEKPGAEGSGMMHEVTEAFGMGCASLSAKRNIEAAKRTKFSYTRPDGFTITCEQTSRDYGTYRYCHSHATPAPNEMNMEQSLNYKNPTPPYIPLVVPPGVKYK